MNALRFRWWIAAKILGKHGRVIRHVTRAEFIEALRKSSEGAADD